MSTPAFANVSPLYRSSPIGSEFDMTCHKKAAIRVLLIEDNSIDARLVQAALADLGKVPTDGPVFKLKQANLLSAGLQRLAVGNIDVVLLDLSLPDSQGLDTVATVRAQAPHVPIIVMTGRDDEALAVKIVRQGAQDYLVKGQVDQRSLKKAIRYAIERRRAEEELRETRENFRSIVETTNEWIWSMDVAGKLTYSNPAVKDILGYAPEELIGKKNLLFMHEDDRRGFEEVLPKFIAAKRGWAGLVLRWRHKNGGYRHLESNAVPILDSSGLLVGYRGADRDITERQRAKQARMQLQLRLVTVQEEERHRLSRELHDQMGQTIAALMLSLKSLSDSGQFQSSAIERLQHVQDLANQLAQQVHTLATDLRPTALDDLGLNTALSNYVEEWAERSNITADFHSSGLTHKRLPLHLETTIYRIIQEALTNILKHAGAQNVSIIVEHRENRVLAIIEDNGCGFDVGTMINTPARERRLGLLGMQERVELVGGTLNIESTLGTGSTIYVRIPTSCREKEGAN
jgi:two-component system sensor histidine kinase UhpB